MRKIKEYKLEIILFFVEAIYMILEMVASRVLSPYFGNSNVVWTAVIGIILLSGSLGNFIGGKIADKEGDILEKLKSIIVTAAIFVLVIPIVQDIILDLVKSIGLDIRLGAIISTILLFFTPNLFLGFIIPIILKIRVTNVEDTGKISGRIYAISTLGGIVGTFLGGFVLVPNFGSIQILLVLPIIMFIIAFFVDKKINLKKDLIQVIATFIAIAFLISYSSTNAINGRKVLNGELNVSVSYDTQYGRVLIKNMTYRDEAIRLMNVGIGFESATYLDENRKYELVFDYLKFYDLMFNSENEIKNCMMIGGAGYGYPKYYISSYEDKSLDVVEIDGEVTNLAKKYFYLDDLIKEYNLDENHRLNIYTEDGRTYLNNNQKKYDAILNDAFAGETPAKILTTLEAAREIKRSLNEGGLYLTNIIGAREGAHSKFIKAEVNTLKLVFKNVYVIPVNAQNASSKANYMVISTDQDINFEGCVNLDLDEDEIVLTDNYAPIDTLMPTENY